jgi:hypothetical protein
MPSFKTVEQLLEQIMGSGSTNGLFSDSESPPKADSGRALDTSEDINEYELMQLLDKSSNQWTSTPDDSLFWSTNNVRQILPPGLYKCITTEKTGYSFQKMLVSTDDLITVPDTASSKVIGEIEKFWTLKKEFKARGFLHKRGVLMYGEPGSGKTASIQLLVQQITIDGGIAIYADDPHVLTGCLQMLRRLEPTRRVIVILEDFETLTDRQGRENEWLSVLDGESQIDDVVFLATTNYIESLDKRFTDRPSRFDIVVPVPMPGAQARAAYIMNKEKSLTPEEVKDWTERSRGFSFAHLKEMIIAVKCLGNGLDATVDRLRDMQRRKASSTDLAFDPDGIDGATQGPGFISNEPSEPKTNEQIDWDKIFPPQED